MEDAHSTVVLDIFKHRSNFILFCLLYFIVSPLESWIMPPLVFSFFLNPLVFISFSGGGGSRRRQGKSAAPSGAAWRACGSNMHHLLCSPRDKGQGADKLQFQAPGPRGRFLEESATVCCPRPPGRLARFRRLPSGFAVAPARGWLVLCFSRRTSPLFGPAAIIDGFIGGS